MPLQATPCYAALLARDARFDGRWFVGVRTTGVYCRPICRVRTPKFEHCEFFERPAQAEAAGFRPCMKCRPELAPRPQRWSTMDASQTLAHQALAWLQQPHDKAPTVAAWAAQLGVSARHLQRLLLRAYGVGPQQLIHTQRLLLAKQLLADSGLPLEDVAAAAGFGSRRRLDAAVVAHYRVTPAQLRRAPRSALAGSPILPLAYRPPYAVQALLQFLAARAIPGVECVDVAARRVQRSLRVLHQGQLISGVLQVHWPAPKATAASGAHQVQLQLDAALLGAAATVLPLVRQWLDLDADPQAVATTLQAALPADLCAPEGLRLPGCVDRFELAVRAVLGQQVSVAAARTLASRLVQCCATPLGAAAWAEAPSITHGFPSPEQLLAVGEDALVAQGILRQRAQALRSLAQAWPQLHYARGEGSVAQAQDQLCALSGIGPWTAQYMLMRGWSWPDQFLGGDLVLRRMLSPDPAKPLSAAALQRWSTALAPYRSYAVMHTWHHASAAATHPAAPR
ncbi:DNA-3-methyladenine glycosylase 2 family protein [Roseateles sp. BYS180W]|uniref:DNA-3-methyladenine glycosylase II n=1 Tax=Roseateles rivi TaxID=3299028 RepID=A0ABW7FSI4_9BURK